MTGLHRMLRRRLRSFKETTSMSSSSLTAKMKVPLWAKVVFGVSLVGGTAIFARKVIFKRKPQPKEASTEQVAPAPAPASESTTTPSSSKRWFESEAEAAPASTTTVSSSEAKSEAAVEERRHGIERLVTNAEDLKVLKDHPHVSNMLDDLTAFYGLDKAAFTGVLNGCLELLDLEKPEGMPEARWNRIKPRAVSKISATIVRALRDLRSKITDVEQKKTFDAAASEIQQICNDQQFNAFQDASK